MLRLNEQLVMLSLPFEAAGDEFCASIIQGRAPLLASSLVELADQNTRVRRMLETMLEGGAVGAVLIAALSIVVPVAQHHGFLPGSDPFIAIFAMRQAVEDARAQGEAETAASNGDGSGE